MNTYRIEIESRWSNGPRRTRAYDVNALKARIAITRALDFSATKDVIGVSCRLFASNIAYQCTAPDVRKVSL